MTKFKIGNQVTIINKKKFTNKTTKIINIHSIPESITPIYEVEPKYDENPFCKIRLALFEENELMLTKLTKKPKHQIFNI